MSPKDYVHRVGRTARAGKAGRAVSLISQYEIEEVQKIEALIEKQLQPYSQEGKEGIEAAVHGMEALVVEKMRVASEELKLKMEKRGVEEQQNAEKYEKYGKKIFKKKVRNKKKRVTVDV